MNLSLWDLSRSRIACLSDLVQILNVYKRFSLKHKILILLLSISLVSGLIFLVLSISTFKNDKIAYIFETNNSLITSVSEQFKKEIMQAINSSKLLLLTMSADGSFAQFTNQVLPQEQDIEKLEIYKIDDKNNFNLFSQLSKENTELGSTSKILQRELLVKNKILKTIDDKILIAEIIQVEKTEIAIFCYFKSDAMRSFFEQNKSFLSLLVDSKGEIIKLDDNLDPQFVEQNFLRFFKESSSLGSSTLKIKTRDKKNWLMSSVAVGYEDYYLVSLVDEEKAMGALKTLTTKSILIFGIIFFAIIGIGIIASGYLTSRLSLLSEAARRVSAGDYKNIVQQQGNDEISELTSNFNQMTSQIVILLNETANKARMEAELKTAQAVQETLLPKAETIYLEAHIKGKYVSATECGGDWWYYSEDKENIYIWIADATGHGASAALLTSAAKSAVTIIETMRLRPSEAMSSLNKAICSVSKENMMMTCFLAQLNKKSKVLTYVNASHEAPIVIKNPDQLSRKDLIFLNEVTSPCLGQAVNSVYEEASIQLEKGNRLMVFTDGVPEIQNNEGVSLGERGFLKILVSAYNSKKNFVEFTDEFSDSLNQFRQSSELVDDVAFCFAEVT